MAAGTETKFLVAFLILVNAIVLLEIGRSTYTLPYRLSGRLEAKPARGEGQRDEDREEEASPEPLVAVSGRLEAKPARGEGQRDEDREEEASSKGGDGGVAQERISSPLDSVPVVFRVSGGIGDAQGGNSTGDEAPNREKPGAGETDINPQADADKVLHEDEEECRRMKTSFRIVPGKNWGSADSDARHRWSSLGCDILLSVGTDAEGGAGGRGSHRLPMDCTARPSEPTDPLIAICAGSTTRGVTNPAVEKLALFIFLLPSLQRTVDCGFNYLAVIGYDVGDDFFDSDVGRKTVTSWFASKVSQPASERGVTIGLELVRVDNKINKPGPVFTAITKAAYERGANYIYRVNDDSEMMTPWAKIFVEALKVMGPPYGVVGPESQNQNILVHDFTHRLHMEIFELQYYPAELTDWYVDDWISRVYGNKRTVRVENCRVEHRVNTHGQRYKEDRSKKRILPRLLEKGSVRISNWARDNDFGAAASELLEDTLDGASARRSNAKKIP